MSLWINADSYKLLLLLAELEERPVQTLLRRAVGEYAERSRQFQQWVAWRDSKAAKKPKKDAA